MSPLLAATLAHLTALVAYDTRNPPRAIGAGGIFTYLRGELPGFDVTVTDHGAGSVSLLAVRGQPDVLFNVHLDTVPASSQWSADPFALRITHERAIGLGACDIKGAAAALLAASQASRGALGLLLTSDEEGATPRCVREFLARHPAIKQVVVAEPTRCHAVLAHRGIVSARVRFAGHAGHASAVQQRGDSAVHQAVRWGAAALAYAAAQDAATFGGLRGLRCNLGRIEGGIKANMIAGEAEVQAGLRPLPATDVDALLARLRELADPAPAEFIETFRGAPLPANPVAASEQLDAARALATRYGMPVGEAVDFWTEAALFSAAGCTTFVFGPGDIAQAHSADEWVALAELERAAQTYRNLLEHAS
ncbi:MAG TPA: acetylornithine deacetylase [Rhodanobacteraceae bacterium]